MEENLGTKNSRINGTNPVTTFQKDKIQMGNNNGCNVDYWKVL